MEGHADRTVIKTEVTIPDPTGFKGIDKRSWFPGVPSGDLQAFDESPSGPNGRFFRSRNYMWPFGRDPP